MWADRDRCVQRPVGRVGDSPRGGQGEDEDATDQQPQPQPAPLPRRVRRGQHIIARRARARGAAAGDPTRTRHSHARQTRAKGALLAELVPVDQILYLFRVKDEGVMFYYGRRVVRLPSPAGLPRSGGPVYCVLLPDEVADWRGRRLEVVRRLADAQGDPIILVRVSG